MLANVGQIEGLAQSETLEIDVVVDCSRWIVAAIVSHLAIEIHQREIDDNAVDFAVAVGISEVKSCVGLDVVSRRWGCIRPRGIRCNKLHFLRRDQIVIS